MRIQQATIKELRQLINEKTEYRSGPDLIAFFGFIDSYGQGFPSRWKYTEEKLNSFNGTNKIDESIKNLFSPINFVGKFDILDKHIANFNKYLSFDGYMVLRQGKIISIKQIKDSDIDNLNMTE